MEFRQLETFAMVASLLSFRRAAERLNLTQSTVSAQIKNLEEGLGARLFERLGRGVALTGAGEELLRHARSLLGMRDEVRDRLAGRGEARCVLRLRMPQSLARACLPEVLPRFHARHPRAGLEVGDCAFAELPTELRTGMTDAAFLLADSIPFAELTCRPLAMVGLTLVRAAGVSGPDVLCWEDLGRESLFLPRHDCSYKMLLEAELRRRGVAPRRMVELNCLETLFACVERGEGLTLAPQFSVRERLAAGRLRRAAIAGETFETAALLILRKGRRPSAELAAFLALFEEVLAAACREPNAA